MSTPSMLFEAYSPQPPLGDWQIIVTVKLKKGRIAVERWHSSDLKSGFAPYGDQKLYIETGIRAFRRQMPILATALEKLDISGQPLEEVVCGIFDTLARVYGGAFGAVQFINGSQGDTGTEVLDFLQQQKEKILSDLLAETT